MKRSDMIKLMSNILKPVLRDAFDSDAEAKFLLKKMEEKGILPPFVDEMDIDYNGLIGHRWEDERDS